MPETLYEEFGFLHPLVKRYDQQSKPGVLKEVLLLVSPDIPNVSFCKTSVVLKMLSLGSLGRDMRLSSSTCCVASVATLATSFCHAHSLIAFAHPCE